MTRITNNRGIVQTGGQMHIRNAVVGDNNEVNIVEPQTAGEVVSLLQQFRAELEKNQAIDADARSALTELAARTEAEATKQKPNRTLGTVTAAGLKEAANTVADIAPTLLSIATRVAAWFAGI